MQFLNSALKKKIVRTRLYGDQKFSLFELELVHTPILQRLYGLKQLGFTDRVYPDAIHSRFNHILGATEVVDRMASSLIDWLDSHPKEEFRYRDSDGKGVTSISGFQLAELVRSRIGALRLMALLHDTTHGAFGHTLEDEVSVFSEKHDNPERQARFFDGLVSQILYLWVCERRLSTFDGATLEELSALNLSEKLVREGRWAQDLAADLDGSERALLANHLRDVELACRLLLLIEFAHGHNQNEPRSAELFVSKVIETLEPGGSSKELLLHRDLFLVDLVGNTICADLLDYAKRDADHAGLRVQFDTRFLRYLGVVSVDGDLSPTANPAIRIAIQVFTNKMRHDVLSEISGILKARYLINERVLYHPTKCAAGAMLGTAVQLLGLHDLQSWMQVLGDAEFLAMLAGLAGGVEHICDRLEPVALAGNTQPWFDIVKGIWSIDNRMAALVTSVISTIVPTSTSSPSLHSHEIDQIRVRARGARSVLWRLNSRRLPKLAYRLGNAHHTGGDSDETIANKFSRPQDRYDLERRIEGMCNLPIGSVVVHCPKHKTSMKVAEALVVGSNLEKAARLRDVTVISPEGLEPYQREIRAIEDMYKSIWHFHAFLDVAYWDKQPIVALALGRVLDFPNDRMLADELSRECSGVYAMMAGEMLGDIAPNVLPKVVQQIDSERRMRLGKPAENDREKLLRIIREVSVTPSSSPDRQMDLPGIEPES